MGMMKMKDVTATTGVKVTGTRNGESKMERSRPKIIEHKKQKEILKQKGQKEALEQKQQKVILKQKGQVEILRLPPKGELFCLPLAWRLKWTRKRKPRRKKLHRKRRK